MQKQAETFPCLTKRKKSNLLYTFYSYLYPNNYDDKTSSRYDDVTSLRYQHKYVTNYSINFNTPTSDDVIAPRFVTTAKHHVKA